MVTAACRSRVRSRSTISALLGRAASSARRSAANSSTLVAGAVAPVLGEADPEASVDAAESLDSLDPDGCEGSDDSDVLEALKAADRGRARLRIPIIVIAMGRRGRLTRLIGGEFGSAATFATVGEGSAPGQVSVPEVRQTLQILAGED